MLLNKIKFAGVVILSLQSQIVFADYSAQIGQYAGVGYNNLLSATEANQEAFTYSQSNSNQNYDFFLQPEIGPVILTIETSRVNATIKNSSVPYVSAQTYSRGWTGINGFVSNRTDTNIGASMLYDLQINATPNTQIPIVMTSYYEMRFKTTPVTYIDNSSIVLGISSASARVGLQANLGSSVIGNAITFESTCSSQNINCSSRVVPQQVNDSLKINHIGNIEPEDYVYGTIAYRDKIYDLSNDSLTTSSYEEFFTKQNIVASFLIDVGENGLVNGGVNIYAEGFSDATSPFNYAESYAYMDPYFEISPEYLALHPNTILSFTPGVGNDNPIAAVPEPETYAMFIAGLGLVGFISRRKKCKKA